MLCCCLYVKVMLWWNTAGPVCMFACLLETTRMALLVVSIAVGVALLLWRIPASSFTPHAPETPRYCLHLPRQMTFAAMHACMLILLVSACPVSIANGIAGGNFHTCALTASGGGRCWGYNVKGQASAVHACCVFLHHIQWWSYLMCAAWRWYKDGSKHAFSRCVDKRSCDYCWTISHMCTHNIRRCEVLG